MKQRNHLRQRYLRTRYIIDWNNYNNSRNAVKKTLKATECKYNCEEVKQQKKNNPGSLLKVINRFILSKEKNRPSGILEISKLLQTSSIHFSRLLVKTQQANLST